jgi:hypothetical protein
VYVTFVEETFFREIKVGFGELVQDGVIFRKNRFSLSADCHRKQSFFSIRKSQFVVHRPKIYVRNLPRKKSGYFQDDVCTFLLYEKICGRFS